MYTQSITRTHRTAIILAIDGSGSMAEKIRFRNRQMTKAEAVATITNSMLFELIERARRSGVTAIVQPGGSIRDAQVIDTCNKYGIAMAFCGIRLFHH